MNPLFIVAYGHSISVGDPGHDIQQYWAFL
jgi:hypothetical protein